MEDKEAGSKGGVSIVLAWMVHLLTACGAVLALFAVAAIAGDQWRLALFWLLAALAIDGIDGTLARSLRVAERVPRIHGATLDLVIDYLNYVFVPTLFLWRADLLPAALAPALAAAIQISSLYAFARADMKTDDGYFRGFPALWNLVAFYLFVIQPGAETGAVAVALLVALTFMPIHFIHPFRVRDYRRWPVLLALMWALSTTTLLWAGWAPQARAVLLSLSLASAAVLVAMGLLRTIRGVRRGDTNFL